MHIKQIKSQRRRDFTAVYQCEHCLHEFEGSGYDDQHFHEHVVPDMECPKCHLMADPVTFRPLKTKYPEAAQI